MANSFDDIKIYNRNIDLQKNSLLNADNIYTKTETDSKITNISNNTYTKQVIDSKISTACSNMYTKSEIDKMIEELPTGGFDESGEMNLTLRLTSSTGTIVPLVKYDDGYTGSSYVIYSNYYRKLGDMCFIHLILGNPGSAVFAKGNRYVLQGLPFPIAGDYSGIELSVCQYGDFSCNDLFNIDSSYYKSLISYAVTFSTGLGSTDLSFKVQNALYEIHLKGWYRIAQS